MPQSTPVLVGNVLYGTTSEGGLNGNGTIFSLPILPAISSLNISGSNLKLNAVNGVGGESCTVLASANLFIPLSQWTPLTTNVLTSGGDFTITATNAASLAAPQHFYIIQTTVP